MDEQTNPVSPTSPLQPQPSAPVVQPNPAQSEPSVVSQPLPDTATVVSESAAQTAPTTTQPVTPPAAQPSVEATSAVPAPEPTPEAVIDINPGRQRKVLLVEDDESLASVYMTRLEAEGFGMKRVKNGEDALAVALEFKPELIILDVMMPKISGFDVLDILRNTPETTNIKIIMLTALSQEADKQRAKDLGVDDYLVKSQVVIADVVSRVKQHLGLPTN
jgi:CheY-like chemotaxis protein